MKTIIVLSTALLLLVGCSRTSAHTCSQLSTAASVTECKRVAKSSHEGADASSFTCGGICYGNVYVFDTDEHFKAALETPVGDMEALRASNPKTRTLVIIAGAVPATDAAAIRKVIEG